MTVDGASVMLGKKNGTVKRFQKKHNKRCLGIHCVCHRLNLTGNDSTKNNVLCKACRSCLKALRSIFSRSSQRTAILIRKQKEFNEPVLKTKSHYAVRWEAEETLVTMSISCPKAIKAAFEEIMENKNI